VSTNLGVKNGVAASWKLRLRDADTLRENEDGELVDDADAEGFQDEEDTEPETKHARLGDWEGSRYQTSLSGYLNRSIMGGRGWRLDLKLKILKGCKPGS